MTSRRRADARNTVLVGLALVVPSLAIAIETYVNGLSLFTALALPLLVAGGAITWVGTFDWVVSRGAEVVKATS